MVADSPRIEASCRRSSSSPAAPCWWRTTPAFDIGFLKAAAATHRPRVAPLPGRSTPSHLARQLVTRDEAPQPQARRPSPRCSARRPRPTTGPCTTRGPRSTCCTPCIGRVGSLGVHTLEELASYTSRVSPAAAPQALPRRRPAVAHRGSTCSRTARGGCSTSARPRHPHAASAATSPPPSSAPGWPRWCGIAESVTPGRVPHHARGRGPRAAAHRRAQAALQPPLPPPRAGAVGQAHRRGLPPPVSIVREVRDDGARYVGPFASRLSAESGDRGAARGGAAAPVHPAAVPAAAVRRLRAGPDGPLRRALHRVAERRATTPPWSPRRPPSSAATPRDGRLGAARRGWACWPAQERFEDAGAVRDRMLHLVRGRRARPAAGAARRLPRGRRRPAQPPTAAGSSSASASAASPAPTISPARRRPDALRRAPCSASAEVVAPGTGPAAGRARRRRPRRSCAGSRRPACGSSSLEGEWTCPVHGAGAAARPRSSPWPPRRATRSGSTSRRPPTVGGTGRASAPRRAAPVALTAAG